MVFIGHVRNGTVVFDSPVPLPEGAMVEVSMVSNAGQSEAGNDRRSLYDRLHPVIGAAEGLPPDLAENHDHYLHGRPKK